MAGGPVAVMAAARAWLEDHGETAIANGPVSATMVADDHGERVLTAVACRGLADARGLSAPVRIDRSWAQHMRTLLAAAEAADPVNAPTRADVVRVDYDHGHASRVLRVVGLARAPKTPL